MKFSDNGGRFTPREILAELNATPNRLLGQNFLTDVNAREKILRVSDLQSDDCVLEIGPGLGALTFRLVEEAARVVAVEKDRALHEYLHSKLSAPNFHLISGDALRVEWSTLGLPEANVKIIANLPYSISKPFLRRVYEDWRPHLSTATLMLQKEVAQRLVAAPDTSEYGPMAIMAQLWGQTKIAFNLAPGAFWPPPAVSSSVVHIVLRSEPNVEIGDEKFFWRVVRAAFSTRRKQLVNTLREVVSDKEVLARAMNELGIDPMRRGETLSLGEFAALAIHLEKLRP